MLPHDFPVKLFVIGFMPYFSLKPNPSFGFGSIVRD